MEKDRPGPRTPSEVTTMLATSAVIPVAATWHWLRGLAGRRRLTAQPDPAPDTAGAEQAVPQAVLFDRDGTLVDDVAYNGDPARVVPVPGARGARPPEGAGIPTAVITNQSGVARGLLTLEQFRAVNQRIEELLGPVGPWFVCPHGPDEGCDCRKPAPGLVLQAAEALGVPASACAVIGDIGSDIEAARAARARGVLVPTPKTRPEEVAEAPEVARDIVSAVERLLGEPA